MIRGKEWGVLIRPYQVERSRSHLSRRGVNLGHTLQGRPTGPPCGNPDGGGAARVAHLAEGRLRVDRTSRVLDCRRGVFGPSAWRGSFLVRKRSPNLVGFPRGLRGRTHRTHALRYCYLASEGAAALVWFGTHHYPADNPSPGRQLRVSLVGATVADARVRAVVV